MATAAEIQQIYKDVLGRSALSGGLNYWLGTGDSIDKIRDDIAKSDEAQGKVADLYKDLLNRDITSTGTDEFATNAADEKDASYWLGEGGLGSGSLADVEANIKLSDEYKNLHSGGDGGDGDDGHGDPGIDEVVDDITGDPAGDELVDSDEASSDTQDMIDEAINKIKTVDTSNVIDSDSTSGIHSIDTAGILSDIKNVKGDIHSLQGKFAGLGDQTLTQVENIIDTKYGAELANLSSTYKADVTDLKSQIGDLSTKTTKKYLDLESALGKASDQFGTRLDDMQTDWQGKFKAGQASLGDKITAQGSAFDKRLRDLSASMNYKMLDDSATGVQTRRSKAFKSGRTSKGTGQLGRSLRLKSLNI